MTTSFEYADETGNRVVVRITVERTGPPGSAACRAAALDLPGIRWADLVNRPADQREE